MPKLPRFVILQHTVPEHRALLRGRLQDIEPLSPLAPLARSGEIGRWEGIEIACFAGGEPERVIVPILAQPSVEYIFCLGLAGSLSAELRRGDLVAPAAVVRGDGVTDYWADPKLPAVAEMGALSALNTAAQQRAIPLHNGLFYSTATWYRQVDFIEQWAKLGVVGIQFELAQYYLLAHLHGKKAAGLYMISDAPWQGEAVWRDGFQIDEAFVSAGEQAVDLLLDAIGLLARR